MRLDLIACWLMCVTGTLVQAKRGILVTAPSFWLLESPEMICVSFHDVDFDVTTRTTITSMRSGAPGAIQGGTVHNEVVFNQGTDGCFSMVIPGPNRNDYLLHIQATGRPTRGRDYSFSQNKTIRIADGNVEANVTFIETDKPIYKQTDKVQLRILTVTEDLKPRMEMIPLVMVHNPLGIRTIQWRNVSVSENQGLAMLSFELLNEPMLGPWKISVKRADQSTHSHSFMVEEYVLPKYEVDVQVSETILAWADTVPIDVCSRYTYGQPVKGILHLSVCLRSRYRVNTVQCLATENIEINGCHTEPYALQTYLSQVQPVYVYDYPNMYMFINATVIEEGTGTKIEKTIETNGLSTKRYDITFVATSDELKPDIDFTGKVKVVDKAGGVVSDLEVELSVAYTATPVPSQNLSTDSSGFVAFTYSNLVLGDGSSYIRIKARLTSTDDDGADSTMRQDSEVSMNVNVWYSPSNSFMKISKLPETMRCGETFGVHLPLSNQNLLDGAVLYKIVIQKRIVSDGQLEKRHTSGIHRKVRSCIRDCRSPGKRHDDVNAVGTSPCIRQCLRGASLNFTITLPNQEWGDATLLIYTVTRDGEIVADSADFKINYCINHNVTMEFNQPMVAPGDQVTITVSSNPHSLCAYGVMDKSIQLIAGRSTSSLKEITDRIPVKGGRYFGWYGDDFSHCQKAADADEEEDDDDDDDDDDVDVDKEGGNNGDDDATNNDKDQVEAAEPTRPPRRKRPRGKRPRGPKRNRRPRRHSMPYPGSWYSRYKDSSEAFQTSNLVVLSDLTLETRPCKRRSHMVYYSAPMPMPDLAVMPGMPDGGIANMSLPAPNVDVPMFEEENMDFDDSAGSGDKVVDSIRSFFPETWLWDLVLVGPEGSVEITREAPDTITEWIGHAVCTSQTAGLGISNDAALKTFQPFFVSLNLPYSAIRGETLLLPVSIFNYLSECLVISIEMLPNTEYDVLRGKQELCVCGQEKVTHHIPITARTIGQINVTVTSESVENAVVCGNFIMSSQTGVRDTVIRELLVEPEGKEEEFAFSSFMCPKGAPMEESQRWTVPSDIVPGSLRTYVSTIGDVMGPALSGLDDLLKMPTGCGEQNMLKFAPNIYILQYLTNVNELNQQIEKKALDYLRIGYQRELQYRHGDGSYSAFGSSDGSGSTWLTAFVLKSFSQAAQFIEIDEADLSVTKQWFEQNQLENGCFRNVGRVLHKSMKGGLAGEQDTLAPLTAYGLVALLEAGYDPNHRLIRNVVECLTVQEYTDVYSAALVSYAYSMLDKDSIIAQNALEKLNQFRTEQDGAVFWKVPSSDVTYADHAIRPVDVEITAYALLAHIRMASDPIAELSHMLPIVRWLTAQRNPNGGFLSTQDTVVALQALAEFAVIVKSEMGDVIVNVNVNNDEHNFMVTEHNHLLLQKDKLDISLQPGQGVDLHATATGEGCAFIQTSMKYNILNITQGSTHNIYLDVSTSRTTDNICYRRILNVCIRYEGPDEATNMALLDVKMVTGWSPIKESVEKLLQDTTLHISRYEHDKKNVNFYFTELARGQDICLDFQVEQDIPVHNPKPGTATVYDYYDQQEVFYQTEYSLRSICGTKEELPFNMLPPVDGEITQMREPIPDHPILLVIDEEDLEGTIPEPCPTCYNDSVDTEALKTVFCNASRVYRGMVKNPGVLKIHKDLVSKVRVNRIASVVLSELCSCSVLDNKKQWVWITTSNTSVVEAGRRRGSLELGTLDMVMPVPRKARTLERLLRKVKKSKKCRKSRDT